MLLRFGAKTKAGNGGLFKMINANSKQMQQLHKLLVKHDDKTRESLCAYICKQDKETGTVMVYRTNGHYFVRFEISNFGIEFEGPKAFTYNCELAQFIEYSKDALTFEQVERVHPKYEDATAVDYYVHYSPEYLLLGAKIYKTLKNCKDSDNPILDAKPRSYATLGIKLWWDSDILFGLMPLRKTGEH